MDNKQQCQNWFCSSMEPVHDYSERLNSKPSSHKTKTGLALFGDLMVDQASPSEPTNVDDYCPSDCESGISGTEPNDQQDHRLSVNGLIRMSEGETIHEVIKKKLVLSLHSYGFEARVESIHRNVWSIVTRRAKLQSFCAYSKAMEVKCNGNSNLKYAWYGGSEKEIGSVLTYGFGLPTNDGVYGQGLYLSPVDHPVESMRTAVSDENGLKHMLLCRVIMGKVESVCPGSRQCNPSSDELDSGVDDLACPKKYIVWASRMNTHVLPEFVVSFRTTPVCKDFLGVSQSATPHYLWPRSDWMPFPNLIRVLSKFLPSDAIESIMRHHSDFKKQKISRDDMIMLVRSIAGDNLLAAIIKSYRGKISDFGKSRSVRAARSNRTGTSE